MGKIIVKNSNNPYVIPDLNYAEASMSRPVPGSDRAFI